MIEIGACYRDPDDGEIVRACEGGLFRVMVQGRGCLSVPGDGGFRYLEGWERVADPTAPPAPAPAPSAEPAPAPAAPASEDRKPRGVKPPMALIPWSVVPVRWIPETVFQALDLSDEIDPEGSETFAASVIRILLETEGDDFMYEIALAMGHGAEKYGFHNWETATWDARARVEYESAMLRHLYADAIGEPLDPDSGRPHKAHAAASAMILEWHDRRAARAEVG